MEMIGVGWPPIEAPAGTASGRDVLVWLGGLVVMLALSAIVIWRGRRVPHERRAEPHIERPAHIRKAA
jgi:uncharacterized iron-regulated membrane protein